MSFVALKRHAASLPSVTCDIKWGVDWVASVGTKMFFAGGREPGRWSACSFRVDEHRFLELSGLPGLAPAPYLARVHWVQLRDPSALPLADLRALVTRSYDIVFARLSRKLQKELLS